jgi:hypothetical protein
MIKTNKKVGILTFHYSYYNYGAVLQTYSIFQLIKTLGCEPCIINYLPEKLTFKSKLLFFLQKILGFQFDLFRKKYIPNIYNKTTSISELKKLNNYFDCFVVGSDQVWRYRENHTELYRYFFDFVDDENLKISYAASFGLDHWEGNEEVTQKVKNLLKRFQAISVREESGVDICCNIMKVNATCVLDPTLVLDRKYFYEIAESSIFNNKVTKNYMAYMLLDNSIKNETFFKNIASEKNIDFINIKGRKISEKKNLVLFNNISKWLCYIKRAEIIVTDSFHCVVFSIIFRRKFVCIINEKRGTTRLENLLKLVGLQSRLFTSIDKVNKNIIFTNNIDFEEIEKKISMQKNISKKYLKNCLYHDTK